MSARSTSQFLALDRMDLQYSTKEVCRGMAAPTRGHVKKLRRLIRYLIEAPRVVTEYEFQGDVREMEVFSDSNWAGCRRTETLSSAEAELLAAVETSGEALGMLQLMSSVGVPMTASIMVDSSAALAVVARKGNGKLRHVRVVHLWVQQVAADGGLKYHKVNGEENPSDACTKHLTGERLRKLAVRGTVPKVGASARVAPRAACADCAGKFAQMPSVLLLSHREGGSCRTLPWRPSQRRSRWPTHRQGAGTGHLKRCERVRARPHRRLPSWCDHLAAQHVLRAVQSCHPAISHEIQEIISSQSVVAVYTSRNLTRRKGLELAENPRPAQAEFSLISKPPMQ